MTKLPSLLFFLLIFSIHFFCISCTSPELSQKAYHIPPSVTTEEISLSENPDDIKLAAGDILTVDVWGQSALKQQIILDPSGYIYYPLIGRIKAFGMTINQLQFIVTQKLSNYYVDPKVSITPTSLSGQRYYVLGEVDKPGKFVIDAKTAVLKAVASAGGPSHDAADIVVLIRKQQDTLQIFSIPLQFSELNNTNVHSVTTLVQAGDVLYLPPSNMADIERRMMRLNNILNPLLAIERGIMYWPSLVDAINGSSGNILVQ